MMGILGWRMCGFPEVWIRIVKHNSPNDDGDAAC